jgi:hypothetical protein
MSSTTKNSIPTFRLQKWYMDCVSEKGEVFIGYSAKLDWKFLDLTYASFLEFDGKTSKTQTSLLKESIPEYSDDSVVWKSKNLSCSGNWQNIGAKLPALKLFEDSTGSVIWNARFPLSDVHISHLGSKLMGLGYVEKLDLTIPPWKLPIEELIWGRFISKDIYIVWIEWSGSHPLTLVYVNGKKIKDASVSNSGVYWKEGTLQHKQSSVIREGPVVDTALSKIPGIQKIFPKKIINMHERKWLSSSVFSLNGTSHLGWTIHETVQFQKGIN